MISVFVLYPSVASSRFDLDYYVERHLPLVRDRLTPMSMRSLTFTVMPSTGDEPPPYRLIAELRFDDMVTTERALATHGPETQADIPNFTDLAPIIIIGETREAGTCP